MQSVPQWGTPPSPRHTATQARAWSLSATEQPQTQGNRRTSTTAGVLMDMSTPSPQCQRQSLATGSIEEVNPLHIQNHCNHSHRCQQCTGWHHHNVHCCRSLKERSSEITPKADATASTDTEASTAKVGGTSTTPTAVASNGSVTHRSLQWQTPPKPSPPLQALPREAPPRCQLPSLAGLANVPVLRDWTPALPRHAPPLSQRSSEHKIFTQTRIKWQTLPSP